MSRKSFIINTEMWFKNIIKNVKEPWIGFVSLKTYDNRDNRDWTGII